MKQLKVAINGFGRIGRLTFRNLVEDLDIDIVAINDLTEASVLAHLLKYDTSHGRFRGNVVLDGSDLVINDRDRVKVFAEKDPSKLPWGDLGVDVVLESTGIFLSMDKASLHLQAGAKRVLLSAPPKTDDIRTIVLGVNEKDIQAGDRIISNASCTTNCLAPMAKVLHEAFGIQRGFMNTIHAYTADQRLQDAPHSDLRRARAAAESIVPTTTGAAKTVGKVYPPLKGKLDGLATRVPVIAGSITDLTAILDREASKEEINAAMKNAANGAFKGIIEFCEDEIVSSDIVGNDHSCIFDSKLTMSMGSFVKVQGWYDNEAGYSRRCYDLIKLLGNLD